MIGMRQAVVSLNQYEPLQTEIVHVHASHRNLVLAKLHLTVS